MEQFAKLVAPNGLPPPPRARPPAALILGAASPVRQTLQLLTSEDPEPILSSTLYSKTLVDKTGKAVLRVIGASDLELVGILGAAHEVVGIVVGVDVRNPRGLRKRLERGVEMVREVERIMKRERKESGDGQERRDGENVKEDESENDDGDRKGWMELETKVVFAIDGTSSEVVGNWEDTFDWGERDFECLSCEIRRFAIRHANRAGIVYLGDYGNKERASLLNSILGKGRTEKRFGLTDLVIPGCWDSEAFVDTVLQGRGIDCTKKDLLESLPEIRDGVVEDDPWQWAFQEKDEEKDEEKEDEEKAQVVDYEAEEQEFLKKLKEIIVKKSRENAMSDAKKAQKGKGKVVREADEEDTQSFFQSLLK